MADTYVDLALGRFTPKQTQGTLYQSGSGYGALRVAQLDPEAAELTRAGRRFRVGVTGAVTGIAPVQALPTTAAQWVLFNNSTTDTYTIDEVGAYLFSGTAGAGIVVAAAFYTLPTSVATKASLSIQSCSNSTTKSSSAFCNSGVTITTPAAPSWFIVAKCDTANTAVGSVACLNTDLKGRLMVPPQNGLALAVISPAGTSPLFTPHLAWTEGAQDLE